MVCSDAQLFRLNIKKRANAAVIDVITETRFGAIKLPKSFYEFEWLAPSDV